uniref:Uncharacterized protein n=1 Tax=Panagrolaimus sp. JU765 TaxID=591449 RepID=A0AC34R1X8_9BILA
MNTKLLILLGLCVAILAQEKHNFGPNPGLRASRQTATFSGGQGARQQDEPIPDAKKQRDISLENPLDDDPLPENEKSRLEREALDRDDRENRQADKLKPSDDDENPSDSNTEKREVRAKRQIGQLQKKNKSETKRQAAASSSLNPESVKILSKRQAAASSKLNPESVKILSRRQAAVSSSLNPEPIKILSKRQAAVSSSILSKRQDGSASGMGIRPKRQAAASSKLNPESVKILSKRQSAVSSSLNPEPIKILSKRQNGALSGLGIRPKRQTGAGIGAMPLPSISSS